MFVLCNSSFNTIPPPPFIKIANHITERHIYKEKKRENRDLENSDFVIEKARSPSDVVGGHRSELVIFETTVFNH